MSPEPEVKEVQRGVRDDMSPEVIVSWRDKVDDENPVVDKMIATTIAYATALDIAIKRQTKTLNDMKKRIVEFASAQNVPAKTVNLEVDGAVCKVTFKSDRVVITNPAALQNILGKKMFGNMVFKEFTYKPSDKLKEMAVDANHKLAPKLREVMAVKPTAPALSFGEK